ncbi:hypothetical protein [Thomasclavelia cocleata]|uniref:hypothetical protein n=1 Tax=Thomasclavelia cocleata TaxID=69824 RepID=UPI001B7FF28A|nr:hypothetical protein [Thomasclavelia cocleata]
MIKERNKKRKKYQYMKCVKTNRPSLTVGKIYKILRLKNSTHDIRIEDDNHQPIWITPGASKKEQFSLVLR